MARLLLATFVASLFVISYAQDQPRIPERIPGPESPVTRIPFAANFYEDGMHACVYLAVNLL